jgi:hypothetical protein
MTKPLAPSIKTEFIDALEEASHLLSEEGYTYTVEVIGRVIKWIEEDA